MKFESRRVEIITVLLVAASVSIAACQRKPQPETTIAPRSEQPADPEWNSFVAQWEEAYFKLEPAFAVGQGKHEFDGQLPDWTAAGIKKEIDWLSATRAKAAGFAETNLNPAQRFEREYVLAVIDGNLFWMQDAESPFRNPAYYLGSLDPSAYLTRPYAPPAQRLKAFIEYAKQVPAAAAQIRANVRTPMPKTFVDYGNRAFSGFVSFYREDVPKVFAAVDDAQLQSDFKAAIEPAAKAMQQLADWFKSQQAKANDDFALGGDRFTRMLFATERVDTPLSKLSEIGQLDLQRNLNALKQACAQFAPNASLKECSAKVNEHKPEGGPVAAGVKQLGELRQFIIDHQLASIPGAEMARVDEAPAYNRSNLAYINVPGPYDIGMPSTYYIAPPDPSWSAADQAAYIPSKAFLEFVTVHEVWPGHFLQFLHANRSASRFGQLFVGYGFAEGWAHYGEEMMWEAGLGKGDPETHIGQLMNALMRNVRFICAIGLHTQEMTVGECETLFRDQALLDPGNARQQAARGTYDPAYLNYTMGKWMIRKLREDWTAAHGGRRAWLSFHDKFLSYGGPPIPLVRTQMLEKKDGELF